MTESVPARWLVLLFQAAGRSSSARVRIWRRLQEMGAVQIRQAAYVLPNREQAREDLEWLKAEILATGGQATVLLASATDGFADDEIVAVFRAARAADVARLTSQGRALVRRLARRGERPARDGVDRATAAFVARCRQLATITFFDTPGTAELEELVAQLTNSTTRGAGGAGTSRTLDPAAYRRRRWITRPRPGVDRMASAWLIRTFIDPEARFAFAGQPEKDAVPFDMFGVEFGHQGDACTFEVLRTRFGVEDTAVDWIARIVHDVDLRDRKYDEAEAAGVELMVDGLRRAHPDDGDLLERGIALFHSLAKGYQARVPEPRTRTATTRRATKRPRSRARGRS